MLTAIISVAVIALVAGLVLAVASVLLAVPRDELVENLRAELPGANCGACGFSGCDGYAAAMAHDGAKPGLCTPGGEATLKATSALLGMDGELVHNVAAVRCGGCLAKAPKSFAYTGVSSCRAVSQLYGGDKQCTYGCLGYGDCAAVCEYGGITLEDGVATVHPELCKGCGQCVAACPKGLISLCSAPTAAVQCASHEKGAAQRKLCTAGCIGCMKCEKVCEHEAIHVDGFLASIDPAACVRCGACAEACPVGCIRIDADR